MATDDFDNPTQSSSSNSHGRAEHDSRSSSRDRLGEFGQRMFGWRDYTPIPLIILVFAFASPSAISATLGTLLIVAGELVRIYSVAFIGSVSRTRNIKTTGNNLITGGPFAYVRNPLYVGNFLIAFGFAVYSGTWWLCIVTALAFAFQYVGIVHFEERLLRERFGQDYEDFQRRVPAWFPKRLPRPGELDWPDSFAHAMRSERRTLTAIGVLLLIMMVLS